MTKKRNDFVPVVKGRKLTSDEVRSDLDSLDDIDAKSEIDLHIFRLLALNPQLKKAQFRNLDLSKFDDSTKRDLLQDMNDLLGIKTLRPVR